MNTLLHNFRRGLKQAKIHHKGAHKTTVPRPEGRTAEDYCECCKGLFGTITVTVYGPPRPNDRDNRATHQVVECTEDDLRAFQTVGRLTGHAFEVVRRRKVLTHTLEDGTHEHYCGRCV